MQKLGAVALLVGLLICVGCSGGGGGGIRAWDIAASSEASTMDRDFDTDPYAFPQPPFVHDTVSFVSTGGGFTPYVPPSQPVVDNPTPYVPPSQPAFPVGAKYFVTQFGEKYHVNNYGAHSDNLNFVRGFVTEADASVAGYTACKICIH